MTRRRPSYQTRTPRPRRVAEPTISTTMRLRRSVRESLEAWAGRTRRSVSDLAEELIEEGLRMRECPGIYFATEPSGRTAKIGATGLGVWEVLLDFVKDENAERLRTAFHWLSQAQLTAALMYQARQPEEIRRQIEANDALTPGEIERRYPGLVRVVEVG